MNGNDSAEQVSRSTRITAPEEEITEDDRNTISAENLVLLIVESDIIFARILRDLARDRDLKVLIALQGNRALALAREFKPGAITLNIGLPDMSGWTLLDRFKHDSETRHVPVHVISADENRPLALALGAMTYIEKPVTRECLSEAFAAIEHSLRSKMKTLLLATPDKARRPNLHSLLNGHGVQLIDVGTGAAALEAICKVSVDAIVVDLRMTELALRQLLGQIQRDTGARTPPVLLYGSRELTQGELSEITRLSQFSVIRHVQSPEQLFYQTVLLLHRAEESLTDDQRKLLEDVLRSEEGLAGRTVLVVDDDIRTIFALTSILEQHNMAVFHAEDGRSGIDLLRKTGAVELVLMDIMMPEMDGYQTVRAIRLIPEFKDLPIIALTANAMKGDREKCIAAGASDYITKPVDVNQLLSLMRVCLARRYETKRVACEGKA
jgi:CheY-like chemotaxis protein